MSGRNPNNRVRLRIAAIELQPTTSKRVIKGEIRIDGNAIDELPPIEVGQPIKWTKLIICDVPTTSRIDLIIEERYFRIYSRFESESCLVSEVINSSAKSLVIEINNVKYIAQIKVLDQANVNDLFTEGHHKLVEMEQGNSSSDKLKVAQQIFKTMLQFGSVVAEAHPAAKIVFTVCTCAWTRLEEQQKSDEQLDELAGKLVGMTSLVEEVKKYARLEPLRQNIEEFLHLIEDVSIFAMSRDTKRSIARLVQSFVDPSDKDQIDQLEKRFRRINSDFSTAIGVQTMATVTTFREHELLKQLKPVKPSGHDPSSACQDGTRLSVLNDINTWVSSTDSGPPLLWIYGQAGMGKSTISASVCNQLAGKETPAVSFFCKRDDPARRDPLRLINSITYGLACRYAPYGKLVTESIANDSELCISHLGVRYEGLLKKPLSSLQGACPSSPCIILVDALDECGTTETRKQLMLHLRDLSSLVPWLRVIVTSRPDSDIRSFFDQCPTTAISHIPLREYSATNDIRAFIEARLGTIDVDEELPVDSVNKLCTKAGELFIWAATACKLIAGALDPHGQLQELTDESLSGCGLGDLDSLYMTAIRNSMTDQTATSLEYMRQCIGAIVVTSMRQPVPVEVLCELLRHHVKPVVMKKVVKRLGAVLYEDEALNGAVRVYHPSFIDFSLDEQRSGEFWVDPVQRHVDISFGCLSAMERELRFNICELETSHLLNSEVPDLALRIKSNISELLAYSCTYWMSHLLDGDDKVVAARGMESVIYGPRLLYWLEVLSIFQKVEVAVYGLRELSIWLLVEDALISRSAWDAYRFALAFFDPIANSVPHIYISALALAPKQSKINSLLSPLFPNTVKVTKGEDERWPAWLRSISHPDRVSSVCVSQDSPLLVTGCGDGRMRIYDLRTGMLNRTISLSHLTYRGVAISPNGMLVSCGNERMIQIWDVNNGDTVASIPLEGIVESGDTAAYEAFSFSNAGAKLRAIFSPNAHIPGSSRRMWDMTWETTSITVTEHTFPTAAPHEPPSPNEPASIKISPDLTHLTVGYKDGRLALQSNLGASITQTFTSRSNQPIGQITFSPDGTMIASTTDASPPKVELWDARTGASTGVELIGHTESITSIAFSPDGKRIATGSQDRSVRMWISKTGHPIGRPLLGHSDRVIFVGFSNDGTYIVSSAGDKTVLVWDATVYDSIPDDTLTSQTHSATSMPYDLNHDPGPPGPPRYVLSVGFSPDGARIISGSSDLRTAQSEVQVQVWDALTGASISGPQCNCDDTDIRELSYSSNGDYIMGKGESGAYIWDTRTGNRKDFEVDTRTQKYAFSSDGARLAIATATGDHDSDPPSESEIVMRDTSNGDIVGHFGAGLPGAQFITFSPNGSRLYSYHLYNRGCSNGAGKMYIWDTQTYQVVKSWDCDDAVGFHALSPDGGSLAQYPLALIYSKKYKGLKRMSHRDPITVRDAHTGDIIAGPLHANDMGTHTLAFSPDGSLLASSSGRDTTHLWNLKSGNATHTRLIGHIEDIDSIAFSPDGTRLVSGSWDGTIRIWDPNPVEPWDIEAPSSWPTNTSNFPPHPTHSDWVSHDQKSHTLWLPVHHRRTYDIHAVNCISTDPAVSPVHIDFSKFVHGTNWTSVRDEEALRAYDASN